MNHENLSCSEIEKEETNEEMYQRIENWKNGLTPKKLEIYELCKSFWETEAGKKAIKKAREILILSKEGEAAL